MGAKKKFRIPYDDWKEKFDIFEYRWNNATSDYYLFNPWTGETVVTSTQDLSILDRSKSMWAKPDKFPSRNAKTTQLYPEYYASRRWGRRKFFGWNLNYDAAAIHIVAVMRGYMTRLSLRRYFRERYHLQVCKFSGYFYYVDNYYPDKETSWYKPLLAFPGDILPAKALEYDPADYMLGEKYSRKSFTAGPFLKISGLSKFNTVRSRQPAFHVENAWRDQAISSYEEIDFENASIGTIVAWMDGDKASQLYIDEYHLMRAAICHNNWTRVITCMREHADNNIILLYGLHNFAKTEVPLDSTGVLSFAASDAMEIIIKALADVDEVTSLLVQVFALNAFDNILNIRAGRLEFLDTKSVREVGDERQKAIERYLLGRFSIFSRFFTKIQTEIVMVYKKGQKDAIPEERPLQRSIDAIEAALKCLCVISQENEVKELLAVFITRIVVRALEVCEEESYVTALALQLFYNCCYRCEGGHEAVSACCEREFFASVHYHHSADADVMRQCRKLELALQPNGWRGNVEEEITKELYGVTQNSPVVDDALHEETGAEQLGDDEQ